jgi:hypothetical protein
MPLVLSSAQLLGSSVENVETPSHDTDLSITNAIQTALGFRSRGQYGFRIDHAQLPMSLHAFPLQLLSLRQHVRRRPLTPMWSLVLLRCEHTFSEILVPKQLNALPQPVSNAIMLLREAEPEPLPEPKAETDR